MLSQIIMGEVYSNANKAQDLSKVKPWQKVDRIVVLEDQAYIYQNGLIKKTSRVVNTIEARNYSAIETRNSVYYVAR